MRANYVSTHRCPERPYCSSIRRVRSDLHHSPFAGYDAPTDWVLAQTDTDFEYDVTYLREFGRIRFCPYCGADLTKEEG